MSATPDDTQRLQRPGSRSEPPGDVHEYLGQVMGGLARTNRELVELQTYTREVGAEVRALRDDLEKDRRALVSSASRHASTHTSNRMAGLLGALFVLYTEAAPYLHELWRMVHR